MIEPKQLQEFLSREVGREFLAKTTLPVFIQEAYLDPLMNSKKWYSVKEQLPPWDTLVYCLFPPMTDSFKGRFVSNEEEFPNSWTCLPESGGWLGDEDELIWCELNAKGELEF
jgi:hypothetical protein